MLHSKINYKIQQVIQAKDHPLHLAPFKGSVQRKLTGVKNSADPWTLVSDPGARHYVDFLFGRYLLFSLSPFPIKTGQFIGKFWNNM
jgi:hypothetical protein